MRLGLRRFTMRRGRTERVVVEEELYDDLRDADGMIDLGEYAALHRRHHETIAYLDLATGLLEDEARRRIEPDDLDGSTDRFEDLSEGHVASRDA